MGRMGRGAAMAVVGMVALSACEPTPPFEPVNDPFSPTLPEAAPVQTAPLPSAGAASPVFSGDNPVEVDPGVPGEPIELTGPGETPNDTVTFANESGLVERLPNTCSLEQYESYTGSDAAVAQAEISDRPVRVIGPGEIVSQEYDPRRVNLYTNGGGQVQTITCG